MSFWQIKYDSGVMRRVTESSVDFVHDVKWSRLVVMECKD